MSIGIWQIAIVVILVVLLFGRGKISSLMGDVAKGPKDFPFMLKKVGSWIGTTKRYISNIQNEVADLDISSNEIEKPAEEKNNDKI